MTCNFCGATLPSTALFCGECGRSLGLGSRPIGTIVDETIDLQVDPRAPVAPEPEPIPEQPPELEPEVISAPTSLPATDPWLPSRLLPPVRPRQEPTETDTEATRIVPSTLSGLRFVLQFSTGESVTVFGNGLVGRNPVPEPTEYFDHLVTIVDPGKSVSKTHLEFGQAAGAFWVSDRYSGNGTVVREPDGVPLRCESGKRYRIVRGTRVIMGDQFFVVS